MIPLKTLSSDPGSSDRLAQQVIDKPALKPVPAIESWAVLLQPKALHLRLMPLCDAECEFCETMAVVSGDKAKEDPFPPDMWERVKEAWLPGLEGIEVAGLGEPTLSKLFGAVAKDVLSAGKLFYFPTNGHWLDQPFVTDPLGDGTNVRVSISLDAGTPETYIKVGRGKDTAQWFSTLAAVKTFREKCPNATLHSQFTATIQNIDDLPAWVQTCADLGIKDLIMRFAMMLTVGREDNSLRFAKSRTEAAIEKGRVIAEANALNFTAERRPYSDDQPEALTPLNAMALDTPESRLRRYLDLAPMSAVVCPSSCVIVHGVPSTTTYTLPDPVTATLTTLVLGTTEVDTVMLLAQTCYRSTVNYLSQRVENGVVVARVPNSTIIDPCPNLCIGAASIGEPEIVRSVVVPLASALQAMSVPVVQPVIPIDASPVVWSDGSISSCFAKHIFGDVYQDTMPTLIRNPEYQNFLQTRNGFGGGIENNENCMNCPRIY